jgi:hypothetical protein
MQRKDLPSCPSCGGELRLENVIPAFGAVPTP